MSAVSVLCNNLTGSKPSQHEGYIQNPLVRVATAVTENTVGVATQRGLSDEPI